METCFTFYKNANGGGWCFVPQSHRLRINHDGENNIPTQIIFLSTAALILRVVSQKARVSVGQI